MEVFFFATPRATTLVALRVYPPLVCAIHRSLTSTRVPSPLRSSCQVVLTLVASLIIGTYSSIGMLSLSQFQIFPSPARESTRRCSRASMYVLYYSSTPHTHPCPDRYSFSIQSPSSTAKRMRPSSQIAP